jgi:hypothetical protein
MSECKCEVCNKRKPVTVTLTGPQQQLIACLLLDYAEELAAKRALEEIGIIKLRESSPHSTQSEMDLIHDIAKAFKDAGADDDGKSNQIH